MLRKWLTNKKLLILLIALFVITGVVVALVLRWNAERNNEKKESQVEVLGPDEVSKDDATDVSDLWGDSSESDKQDMAVSDDTDKSDKSEQSDKTKPTDKTDDPAGTENDENVLKDDIIWGDIY